MLTSAPVAASGSCWYATAIPVRLPRRCPFVMCVFHEWHRNSTIHRIGGICMPKFIRLAVSGAAFLAIASTPVALTAAVPASAATVSVTSATHSARAATSWPVVRRGARGERVWAIQYLLKERGYALRADGFFGSATARDVRRFQRVRGLRADGVVGARTWDRL